MMEGLNSNSTNAAIGLKLKSETGSDIYNITVSHGPNQLQVAVPSNSTFGDLKSLVAQEVGLKPETLKLLFRGKEKEDDDHLHEAGVKDGSKVLAVEDTISVQKIPEEVETVVVSRGDGAVAKVREEVDKLADQVAALQAVVDGGTKVDDKGFLYLTEMLMRQLLKLDGIEAEGEGRVKRKMEVRRVQSLVETVDTLKSRNANHDINNNSTTASDTTQCETFEHGTESASTESSEPSSNGIIPSDPLHAPAPVPESTCASVMSSSNTPVPVSFPDSTPVPSSSPSCLPSPTKEWLKSTAVH
ncbi:BAG family molecular chaperone regulator 4-like isoform X1 [Salvia hispanica]|uniref:BAG family molecular chaperone regulator 4-like isoform X1 n=1 Tax=Salvia hispanica TaxID=49212 RepID=UPI002009C445|nr:BAG family molecular chaperone regulator 4-like isoform X1 [Salvia hispanica]